MSKTRIAFVAALVAVLAGAIVLNGAPQSFFSTDLTIRQTQTSSGPGAANGPTTTFLSGNAMRHSGPDGQDVIVRLDQGKMITVDNKKKTYSEITFKELEDMMAQASDAMKDMPPEAMAMMKKMMGNAAASVSVTKAGPGENIAGYATEKYIVKGPMEMEIWAAPALKVPAQYYDAIKARMPKTPMFDMGKLYDEMKKINGYPLKQVTTMKMMGRESRTETVATAVDKGAIAKSTFEPPAGFKKVDWKQ